MRKNLLFILIGFLLGVGTFILDQSLGFYLFIILSLAIIFSYLYKNPLIFLAMGILFGFFYSHYSFSSYKLAEKSDRNLKLTIIDKNKKNDSNTYTVIARDLDDGVAEKSIFSSSQDYNIADQLYVYARVDIANTNTNPYLFSYRKYLLSQKIKSKLDFENVYLYKRSSSILLNAKDWFYRYIHRIFEENLSLDRSNFVTSVILSENLIEREDFTNLGIAHVLAVSGLHIDILLAFILLAFSHFNLNYKYGLISANLICFFYGYLISFPYSVLRVLIMTSIKILSFFFRKPFDNKKSLILSALAILFINPFAVFSPGYVLTFAASIGIYLIYPKLKLFARNSFIKRQLIFALAIQMAIFPFIIYYYGKINLISIVANLMIVPIFEISMYFIFGIIFLYPILGGVLSVVFWILDFIIGQILDVISFLANFSIFLIKFKKESILLTVFFLTLILILLYGKKYNRKLNKLYFGLSIIIVGFLSLESFLFENPKICMVDIGQGDCFILKDKSNIYLFDVGGPKYKNYDSGEKILIPLLEAMGVSKIKAVFISHMDNDHVGNLKLVNEKFKVENVISTPLNKNDLSIYNFKSMKTKDRIKLKNGYIEAVFDGVDGENRNNKAIGFLINIKSTKFLTLGDIESKYEDQLDCKADILKLSHHGSNTSSSKIFIEKVSPKVSLISAGRNNSYGHPHKEVLENVKDTKIYNTKTDGFVEIEIFDGSYKIKPYLKGDFFR